MFDIGKRGSGADQGSDLDRDGLPESGPVGPVAAEWEAPGQGGVRSREAAVIGPSIHIDGTLKGEEDLLIEGHVTGTVQLQDHSLTIGPKGQVEADVYAHTVIVEGQVEGDLYGSERVGVRGSARVRGNITAPRVSLDDGARFKGTIEMDPEAVQAVLGTRPKGGGGGNRGSAGAGERTTAASTAGASTSGASEEASSRTTASAGSGGAQKDGGEARGKGTSGSGSA